MFMVARGAEGQERDLLHQTRGVLQPGECEKNQEEEGGGGDKKGWCECGE